MLSVEGANDINGLLDRPIDLNTYREVVSVEHSILDITGADFGALKTFIRREGITLNVVVQFIWHKLLSCYSNSSQSIVGTIVSGRDLPISGIEDSVGLYINTLPLIIDWDNDHTIGSQLQEIQSRITELNTHSFAELSKLQQGGSFKR